MPKNEGEQMEDYAPEPTDAELDRLIEIYSLHHPESIDGREMVNVCKALRACRQQVAEFGEEIDRLRSGGKVDPVIDERLDETERLVSKFCPHWLGSSILRDLRTLRQQCKAKDAALSPLAMLPVGAEVASDSDLVIYKNAGRSITIGDILRARAALNKEPDQRGPAVLDDGRELLARYGASLPGDDHCHAHQDGDCTWEKCPQIRDGEPQKSGRHCPLDKRTDDAE